MRKLWNFLRAYTLAIEIRALWNWRKWRWFQLSNKRRAKTHPHPNPLCTSHVMWTNATWSCSWNRSTVNYLLCMQQWLKRKLNRAVNTLNFKRIEKEGFQPVVSRNALPNVHLLIFPSMSSNVNVMRLSYCESESVFTPGFYVICCDSVMHDDFGTVATCVTHLWTLIIYAQAFRCSCYFAPAEPLCQPLWWAIL